MQQLVLLSDVGSDHVYIQILALVNIRNIQNRFSKH